MYHYDYMKSFLREGEMSGTDFDRYLAEGAYLGDELSAVSKFNSALYNACKETLNGEYEYLRLIDTNAPFYQMVNRVNNSSRARIGQDVITSLSVHEVYHVVCFETAGKKIYEVSPVLAEALKYTELRGLMADDLRFPYESLVIRVPKSTGFGVWVEDTGWHNTEEIYVTKETNRMHVMLIGKSKNSDPGDNAIFYFDATLKPGDKMAEISEQLHRDIAGNEPSMSNKWKEQFDWALNVLMYITAENTQVEVRTENKEARDLERRLEKAKGTKKEKIKQRLRTLDRKKVIYLGESMKREMIKEAAGVRFRVRGHWHKYWVGKGRSELTTKWIEPYWKGEGAESNPVVRLT